MIVCLIVKHIPAIGWYHLPPILFEVICLSSSVCSRVCNRDAVQSQYCGWNRHLRLAHAPSGIVLRRTSPRSRRIRGPTAMSTPLFRQMKSLGFNLPMISGDSSLLRGLKRPVKLCGVPDRFKTRLVADSTGGCAHSQSSRHRSPYQEAALRYWSLEVKDGNKLCACRSRGIWMHIFHSVPGW